MVRLGKNLLGALIALHLLSLLFFKEPSYLRDVILYNSIWVMALALLLSAPISLDRIATSAMVLAISFWGIGSVASSLDGLGGGEPRYALITQLSYTIFYPLISIAIPRFSSAPSRFNSLELLDALIFGLGFTSITATVISTLVFPHEQILESRDFFTIFYPVGDMALLTLLIIQLLTRGTDRARLFFALGIAIFTASDLYYLWLSLSERYSFGALADDGWLVAIAFIAFSIHQPSSEKMVAKPLPPSLLAISIFISPIFLAVSALYPGTFPLYIVGLLIANLLLSFIRMSTALREARILSHEKALARTDELTGLANRRLLLHEIVHNSHSYNALALLDLNGFKPINDRYGHAVGDLILQSVSKRLTRVIHRGSLLARLGGDEFGLLLTGSNEEILETAQALHASMSYPFSISGNQIEVGVSIGIAPINGEGELLKRADNAMYRAKSLGMGVVHSLSL